MKSFKKIRDEYISKKKKKNEDGPCWDSHKQVGMKKKNGRVVPNCVPKEEAPANSVAGGGVDLTPGIRKTDNRHKYSIGKMFRRNNGAK